MRKIIIAAMLYVLATPAVAADFYAGVKLGPSNVGYSNVSKNNQLGWGVFGGYQISRLFSAEAEYVNLGGFDTSVSTNKVSAVAIKGVGTFPLGEKFSLIGKVGVSVSTISLTARHGWILSESSISNTGVTAGFAGQYNVSPEFGVRAGIDVYPVGNDTINTTTAHQLSIYGVYKF
ncbi:MAG: outer membrane beta-barrel protein [Pseudomonadota bacterium]